MKLHCQASEGKLIEYGMALSRREGHLAAHRAAARERDSAVREAEQCFDGAGLRRLFVGEQPAVRRMLEDALSHHRK